MRFRCLAIETATETMSLSACHGERIATWEAQPAREETHRLYQHAERVLAEVGLNLRELDCIAFGCGPGSFTGVRMAATAAQAIGYGLGIGVCRRSSLAILAAGAVRRSGAACVAACLNAHMGRAYMALYRANGAGAMEPVVPDDLVDPHNYQLAGNEPFLAAGPGWSAYPQLQARHAQRLQGVEPGLLPSAQDLLIMARHDYLTGALIGAADAVPEYLGLVPASVTGAGNSP